MAAKLYPLPKVTVTTAGTPVQLSGSGTDQIATSIIITADSANTGTIYVGDSTVNASTGVGIPLAAGDSATIGGDLRRDGSEDLVVSDLWLDASVNSQAAHVSLLGKR